MKTTVDASEVARPSPIPQPTFAILSRSRYRQYRARRQSSRAFDSHGGDLFRLAAVLSDNSEFAQHLVIQTIVSHRLSGPSSQYTQELSAAVVLAWVNRDCSAWTSDDVRWSGSSPSSTLLGDLHRLPDAHRAVLALCKYGAHTYREAADVLHLSADRAAEILCEALRNLHDGQSLREMASPAS